MAQRHVGPAAGGVQRLRCVWFRLGATQSNGPPIDKARRCWPIHKHERPWTCDATDDIACILERPEVCRTGVHVMLPWAFLASGTSFGAATTRLCRRSPAAAQASRAVGLQRPHKTVVRPLNRGACRTGTRSGRARLAPAAACRRQPSRLLLWVCRTGATRCRSLSTRHWSAYMRCGSGCSLGPRCAYCPRGLLMLVVLLVAACRAAQALSAVFSAS